MAVPDPRTETMRFRCTPAERLRYEGLAEGEHRTVSDWLRLAVNEVYPGAEEAPRENGRKAVGVVEKPRKEVVAPAGCQHPGVYADNRIGQYRCPDCEGHWKAKPKAMA